MYGAHDAVPTSGCEAGRPRDTNQGTLHTAVQQPPPGTASVST